MVINVWKLTIFGAIQNRENEVMATAKKIYRNARRRRKGNGLEDRGD
jgi:hypothetical protein